MARGLLWLPLLAIFIGLAWAGWNEYQKIEAYKTWAESFDRAKYDVYAVLGLKGDALTWGTPTRKGPVALQTLSLSHAKGLDVVVDGVPLSESDSPPKVNAIALRIEMKDGSTMDIPFTEIDLTRRWATFLQREFTFLRSPVSDGSIADQNTQ